MFLLSACQTAKLSTGIVQYQNGEYFASQQTLKRAYRSIDARSERADKATCAFYLGMASEKLMQPQAAEVAFLNARRFGFPDTLLVEEHLANVHRDKHVLSDASRYVVHRFDKANSQRADFSPSILDDKLYFTSSNNKSTGDDKSNITGTKFSDIWVMEKGEKGQWQRPVIVDGGINTPNDEGVCSFSPDGQSMYYTAAGGSRDSASASASAIASVPHIFVSSRSDAKWSPGQMLHFGTDTLTVYAHPAVSPDGAWLYLVSDAPGSLGGYDIFRTPLRSNADYTSMRSNADSPSLRSNAPHSTSSGTVYGAFENLGPSINTPFDEKFPSFAPDGTLYFSSDRPGGFGGLDIYSARQDKWGQWHVAHLDAPINSTADDFSMTFDPNTREDQEGFFSSNRNNGKGYDNIYSFVLPSLKIRISGHVLDPHEQPIRDAVVRVVGRNGMNLKVLTRPDGSYEADIDRSTEYVLMAGKSGYLNRKAQFTSDPAEEDADYQVDFILPSIQVPVLIDNIHYDYNEARLRPESYPALDDLVSLLNDNPYCAIELSAHTDRIGSQTFNLDLSQRRAQSVVDYLVSQGISPDRLTPVGYGKSQPRIIDETLARKYGFPVTQSDSSSFLLPPDETYTRSLDEKYTRSVLSLDEKSNLLLDEKSNLPLDEKFVFSLDEQFILSLDEHLQAIADQLNRRTEFKVLTTTFGLK